MTRQSAVIYILLIIAAALGLIYAMLRPIKTDGLATVTMLNVGQGDSFLIQAENGTQLLIDGGRDDAVLSELAKAMPRGDRTIDVIIATHPDADHIGGLPLVLKRYKVGLFLTSKVFTDTKTFTALFQELHDHEIPSYYVRRGMNLSLDQTQQTIFSIIFPDRDTNNWETNAASVVGKLQIGERNVLFTGDSPASIEQFLARTNASGIDVDILKLGHHGSKTSSSKEFLEATSPALAFISAGINNRYGHPAPEVVDRLKTFNIPFISTQESGTVIFQTDGQKWFRK